MSFVCISSSDIMYDAPQTSKNYMYSYNIRCKMYSTVDGEHRAAIYTIKLLQIHSVVLLGV